MIHFAIIINIWRLHAFQGFHWIHLSVSSDCVSSMNVTVCVNKVSGIFLLNIMLIYKISCQGGSLPLLNSNNRKLDHLKMFSPSLIKTWTTIRMLKMKNILSPNLPSQLKLRKSLSNMTRFEGSLFLFLCLKNY